MNDETKAILEEMDRKLEDVRSYVAVEDGGTAPSRDHDDPEEAHLLEDSLYHFALKSIADGKGDPKLIAAKALEASALTYGRWYA